MDGGCNGNTGHNGCQDYLSNWQLFKWEEMYAPAGNWTYAVSADQDYDIWVATKTGLSHFDGERWDFQPLPENPLVTAVTFTSDNKMWVQTTDAGSGDQSMIFFLIFFVVFRLTGGRFMGAFNRYLNTRTSPEKAKNSS
jgi:hypothetical protein